MQERIGVYLLGDDGVYEWASTLLNSLRSVAPEIEVICIPFSNRIARLEKLRRRLRFEFFEDPSLLELDEIGRNHISRDPEHPRTDLAGLFRKLAVFWGPLSTFLYMDADTVALNGFDRFFKSAAAVDIPFQYALSDISQVYRPGPLREKMVTKYQTHGINSGLWMSKRGTLTLDQVKATAIRARDVVTQLMNLDQPFINYCLDINRVQKRQFDVPGLTCAWPGDGVRLSWEMLTPGVAQLRYPNGVVAPAIHWAGYRLTPAMPYYDMHRALRVGRMSSWERVRLHLRENTEAIRESPLGRRFIPMISSVLKRGLPANLRLKIRHAVMPNK